MMGGTALAPPRRKERASIFDHGPGLSERRDTEILVEHQPPQGVFVYGHVGLVINTFSLSLDKERIVDAIPPYANK